MSAPAVRPWEAMAYLSLLAAALVLRVVGSGATPLLSDEAAGAWLAWQAATGSQAMTTTFTCGTSPLLMSVQWGLFSMGAAGETAARLPVAAMGSALALVPFLLRRRPADPAMLGLAALIAFHPLLVERSRHADGAMPAFFLAAVSLACLWRWRREARASWAHGAALAGGLLTASGREAWPLLPILLVVAALVRPGKVRPLPVGVTRTFAAAAILGGTAAMAVPAFFGGVSASLTGWLVGCNAVQGAPVPFRLAEDLGRLGSHRAGDPAELRVDVVSSTSPDPALAWTLRDFRRLRWVSAPALNPPEDGLPAPVIVVAERDSSPRLSATHLGARYRDVDGSGPGDLVVWVPRAR